MIFRHFLLDVNEANLYVAACEATRQALIVDAGGFDSRVVEFVRERGLIPAAIAITHDHHDHTGGLAQYRKAFGCRAIGAQDLRDGTAIPCGRLEFRALLTPGHTSDAACYYCAAEKIAFTGDTLFAGSIGGTASESQKQQEIASIRAKLFSMPGETILCPGHGPLTTVAIEKAANPFFV